LNCVDVKSVSVFRRSKASFVIEFPGVFVVTPIHNFNTVIFACLTKSTSVLSF